MTLDRLGSHTHGQGFYHISAFGVERLFSTIPLLQSCVGLLSVLCMELNSTGFCSPIRNLDLNTKFVFLSFVNFMQIVWFGVIAVDLYSLLC